MEYKYENILKPQFKLRSIPSIQRTRSFSNIDVKFVPILNPTFYYPYLGTDSPVPHAHFKKHLNMFFRPQATEKEKIDYIRFLLDRYEEDLDQQPLEDVIFNSGFMDDPDRFFDLITELINEGNYYQVRVLYEIFDLYRDTFDYEDIIFEVDYGIYNKLMNNAKDLLNRVKLLPSQPFYPREYTRK